VSEPLLTYPPGHPTAALRPHHCQRSVASVAEPTLYTTGIFQQYLTTAWHGIAWHALRCVVGPPGIHRDVELKAAPAALRIEDYALSTELEWVNAGIASR
jgi:hypothetical protein